MDGKNWKEQEIRDLTGDSHEHQHHSSQWFYKVVLKDHTTFFTRPHIMSEGWRGGYLINGRSVGKWLDSHGYDIRDIREIEKVSRVWGDGMGDVGVEKPRYDQTEKETIFRSGMDGIIPDRTIISIEYIQKNYQERWKRIIRRSVDHIRKNPECQLWVVENLVRKNQIKTD